MSQLDYDVFNDANPGAIGSAAIAAHSWGVARMDRAARAEAFAPVFAPAIADQIRIPIRGIEDIVTARQAGRSLVRRLQFSGSRTALVVTAISELARNMILYARHGQIVLSHAAGRGSKDEVVVTAEDDGPGIADLPGALSGGYSTSGGRGMGLSGLRHAVDEFSITSRPGAGTRVTVTIQSLPR